MRKAALSIVVMGLVVGAWFVQHNGHVGLAVLMVGVAGYYAGHHDGRYGN